MCGRQDELIASLRQQLQHTNNSQHSPSHRGSTMSPPLSQEWGQEALGDELTELLHKAGTSRKTPSNQPGHTHSRDNNSEARSPHSGVTSNTGNASDHGPAPYSPLADNIIASHSSHLTGGQTHFRTAVVSPQREEGGGVTTRHHTPSKRSSRGVATPPPGSSPLPPLDLDHLAEEVRERIAGIFDSAHDHKIPQLSHNIMPTTKIAVYKNK